MFTHRVHDVTLRRMGFGAHGSGLEMCLESHLLLQFRLKCSGFRVRRLACAKGFGFRDQGLGWTCRPSPGFRVQGSGFSVQCSVLSVRGSGFRVYGSVCRVDGFRIQGAGFMGFGSWMKGWVLRFPSRGEHAGFVRDSEFGDGAQGGLMRVSCVKLEPFSSLLPRIRNP